MSSVQVQVKNARQRKISRQPAVITPHPVVAGALTPSEGSYPSSESDMEHEDEVEAVIGKGKPARKVTKVPKVTKESKEKRSPMVGDAPPASSDFMWMYTEEPHRSRRMAILKAHPEVCLTPEFC